MRQKALLPLRDNQSQRRAGRPCDAAGGSARGGLPTGPLRGNSEVKVDMLICVGVVVILKDGYGAATGCQPYEEIDALMAPRALLLYRAAVGLRN